MVQLSESTRAAGYRLITLDSVDSTNRYALDLAVETGADRTFIVAAAQSGGRGRHGRDWVSPPGNLYMTLLLIEPCAVAVMPKLGFLVGVALAEAALEILPSEPLRLKWPNDLVHDGAKLSGILLEGRKLASGLTAVAIGVGVNIGHAPDVPERQVMSLVDLGAAIDCAGFFANFSARLVHWLDVFAGERGESRLRERWLALSLPKGQEMMVRLPRETVVGTFAGIDDAFRLLLATPAGVRAVDAGDVFLNEKQKSG